MASTRGRSSYRSVVPFSYTARAAFRTRLIPSRCNAPSEYKLTVAADDTIAATDTVPAIPVRIYTPRDKGDDLPLVVYFHGGGYISGANSPSLPASPPD